MAPKQTACKRTYVLALATLLATPANFCLKWHVWPVLLSRAQAQARSDSGKSPEPSNIDLLYMCSRASTGKPCQSMKQKPAKLAGAYAPAAAVTWSDKVSTRVVLPKLNHLLVKVWISMKTDDGATRQNPCGAILRTNVAECSRARHN